MPTTLAPVLTRSRSLAVMSLEATIRRHVERRMDDGESRYRIAKDSGLPYNIFVRWLDKRGNLRLDNLEKLAAHLDLVLCPRQRCKDKQ